MAFYNARLDVGAVNAYPTVAQFIVPQGQIGLISGATETGSDLVAVSFDGITDGIVLVPGSAIAGFQTSSKYPEVWVRRFTPGAGSVMVQLFAET